MGDTKHFPGFTAREELPATRPADYYISVPFQDWDEHRMSRETESFIKKTGLEDYALYIRRGALLNHDPKAFDHERQDGLKLKPEERRQLDLERSDRRIDKFRQAGHLWVLVGLCSLGAAVQGWDESAVNGAQIFYRYALSITNSNDLGLINSAPYLCCTVSCLLTYPLNKYLGRRGTIFLTCFISSITCLGQAFPQTWKQLFAARFLLGLGVGPKSATIPIYAAECAPANVRGALVMMWQMWTAFGIMCGYISGVVLQSVFSSHWTLSPWISESQGGSLTCDGSQDPEHLRSYYCSLNWRLMLASPMILPLVVVMYVYTLPESPRWLLQRAHRGDIPKYEEAFMALVKLRKTKLQAARDLFLISHQLWEEEKIQVQQKPLTELFTKPRNRRALVASLTVMFFQQFCGVNVMAYYSSQIILVTGATVRDALTASMGFGIINFVFALPAVWTIDTFGRRNLLLATFPFMAIFQFLVGIAFTATNRNSNTQIALVLTGFYLFAVAYSPGEGPVPFVYSAESMPLYNRDIGMGIVTAVNWFFNFFLAVTWPPFERAYKTSGAFFWYAAWCVIGEITILLIVPETKDLTLEALTEVFNVPTRVHAAHGLRQARWFFRRYFLGKSHLKPPVLLKRGVPGDETVEAEMHGWPVDDETGHATTTASRIPVRHSMRRDHTGDGTESVVHGLGTSSVRDDTVDRRPEGRRTWNSGDDDYSIEGLGPDERD